MKRERCPMAPLIEARRDGRLGERELASVERHMATCSSCQDDAATFARIAALLRARRTSVSTLAKKRARVRLLREASIRPERPVARQSRTALVLLAAVLPLLLGVVLWSRAPRVPASPAASRSETTLTPDQGAQYMRGTSSGMETVTLAEGGVTCSVRPLGATERFIVRTADAEVEVRGTVFRVEARSARISAVHVIEGKVEVRFRGATSVVGQGEAWRPPPDSLPEEAATPPVVEPSSRPPRELEQRSPHDAARASDRPPSAAAPRASATPGAAGQEKEFLEGVRMVERGDYGAAAERLEAFAAAHPEDGSAEDAAFLAIMSLERAGRVSDAAAAARRYLARYPHGFRRAEAERIAAMATTARH